MKTIQFSVNTNNLILYVSGLWKSQSKLNFKKKSVDKHFNTSVTEFLGQENF